MQKKTLIPLIVLGACGTGWSLTAPAANMDNDTSSDDASRIQSLESRVNRLEDNIPLHIGVGVETLYTVTDSSESSREKGGNLFSDKIELIVNGDFDSGLYYDSRWDYQITQQAFFPAWMYIGYDFSSNWTGQIGVVNQPLGAGVDGAYYDNSFLSDVPLWLGLANNPDMGAKAIYKTDNLELVFSFMKNPEFKSGNPNARFRPDVVDQGTLSASASPTGSAFAANVEPINTFGGGGAYTIHFGDDVSTQFGVNGQAGQYYDLANNSSGGDHWAAAAFINHKQGPFALTLQALSYSRNLNASAVPAGQTRDSILLSDGKLTPASGDVYSGRVSYTIPVDLGVFKQMMLYDDYDYLNSGSDDQFTSDNAQFNIAGVRLTTGHFYTWVSVLSGKNANFANAGPSDGNWHTQFNVVGALYF